MPSRAPLSGRFAPGRDRFGATASFFAALVAGGCLAGCSSLAFDAEVLNKTPFTPPAVFDEWWRATEACSGRDGAFDRVSWYLATGITGDGVVAWGRWSEPHDIVIVRGFESDETIVRHEMLHDLLGGDREHASPAWSACDLRSG